MTLDELAVLSVVSRRLEDICRRTLSDGREATVIVQMYNVKLVVGRPGGFDYDDGW